MSVDEKAVRILAYQGLTPFSTASCIISIASFLEPICEPPIKHPLLSSVKPVIGGSGFSGKATHMNLP